MYNICMQVPNAQFFESGLRLMSVCPLCGIKEAPTDTHVVESSEEKSLVHLTCRGCKQAILVTLRVSGMGVQCVGIMTDLSPEDTKMIIEGKPLKIDDVLAAHEALNDDEFLLFVKEKVQ